MIKKTVLTILVLVCIAGGVGAYLYFKPAKSYHHATPDITLEAGEIVCDFTSDENTANAKYLNKVIEVHGTVKDISQDEKGLTSVNLGVLNQVAMVSCSMDSNVTESYSSLAIGDKVKIKGLCSGMLMDVVLVKCVLVK